MTRIPKLTAEVIIRAFFGGAARPYNYEVTEEEFDEDDNEGPGHYYGVKVPDDLGARWDAGIEACRAAGVDTRSADGYKLRLALMHPDGVPAGVAEEVEAYRVEREQREVQANEARERPRREYDTGMAKIAELTSGLTPTGYGPDVYRGTNGWECHWHSFSRHDPEIEPRVQPLGEPLVRVQDWYVDSYGRRATRALLWRTEVGFIVEDPSVHVTHHYVAPELAREYRLRWARLNGVGPAEAAKGVESLCICEDQREMYRAALLGAR